MQVQRAVRLMSVQEDRDLPTPHINRRGDELTDICILTAFILWFNSYFTIIICKPTLPYWDLVLRQRVWGWINERLTNQRRRQRTGLPTIPVAGTATDG